MKPKPKTNKTVDMTMPFRTLPGVTLLAGQLQPGEGKLLMELFAEAAVIAAIRRPAPVFIPTGRLSVCTFKKLPVHNVSS